jgi:hypothetical protein
MVSVRVSWWLWAALVSLTAMLAPPVAEADDPGAEYTDLVADNVRVTPAASACDDECFFYPPRCSFYFRADAVMLRRDVHGATDAATLDSTDNLVLSTRDLDMPFNAGPRFLVGHTFDDSPYQVEFSYFWLNDWNEAATVRDNTLNDVGTLGNLFSPFTGFGATPPDPADREGLDFNNRVSIREFSFLQNMELNLRRQLPMPPGILSTSFLIGARFMGIREQFNYFSVSDAPLPGTTNAARVRTRNELYGFQIGQLFEFNVDQWWWINTELKGAICNNAAGVETVYTHTEGGVPDTSTFTRSKDGTSFIGDLALTLVCRPTAHVTTRLGYQAIWVTGAAIAAKNFNTNVDILRLGPAQLNQRGNVVYHGPHAGIEIAW